jgi:hypothetical protein
MSDDDGITSDLLDEIHEAVGKYITALEKWWTTIREKK